MFDTVSNVVTRVNTFILYKVHSLREKVKNLFKSLDTDPRLPPAAASTAYHCSYHVHD